jgi:DNA adenine methylase
MTTYQGGKNGAGVYQTIINCIPWHWRYVEAFAGSAAIFRHKKPARGGSILIERDPGQAEQLAQDLASSNVKVLQADAIEQLPRLALGAQDFVYLDPPYHPDARRDLDLYAFELTAAQHEHLVLSLLPALSAERAKWAISGYRTALYDDAAGAHGWRRTDYQAMTRRGVVTESLWTNFDPAVVDLHDHSYLGGDFRERERIARKVKRWAGKLQRLPRHERAAIMDALSTTAIAGDDRSLTAAAREA